jgi:hypothetical protein
MSSIGRIVPRRVAPPYDERRARVRMGVVLAVRVRLPHLDAAFCATILDLSEQGVFIATDEVVPIGTELELEVVPPRMLLPLQARGHVVRLTAASQPGLGVIFSWVSVEAQALVARMRERCRAAR